MTNEDMLARWLVAIMRELGGSIYIDRGMLDDIEPDSVLRWEEVDDGILLRLTRRTVLET
jgi:hypothetical protein